MEGLRDVARSYALETSGAKAVLIARIAAHFDMIGWPEQICVSAPTPSEGMTSLVTAAGAASGSDVADDQDTANGLRSASANRGRGAFRQTDILSTDILELIRATIRSYEETRRIRDTADGDSRRQGSERSTAESRGSSGNSVHDWKQIKFARNAIPPFAGKDDESVRRWIERVDSIARLYSIFDESLVVAAAGQLRDRALSWYHRQPIESVSTWADFKEKICNYFDRRESYAVTIARINSRFWRSYGALCRLCGK